MNASLHQENLMIAGLIVPIVLLLIVGIVLGYISRKSKSSLVEPLLLSSGIYAIFIAINALLSRVKFGNDSKGLFGEMMSIQSVLKFSWIDALLTGFFLPLIVMGLAAYVMYYGKNFFVFIHGKSRYVQYAVYSLLLFVVMIVAFSVIGIYSIDMKELNDGGAGPLMGALFALVLAHATIWITNLAHFNPLAFKMGWRVKQFLLQSIYLAMPKALASRFQVTMKWKRC